MVSTLQSGDAYGRAGEDHAVPNESYGTDGSKITEMIVNGKYLYKPSFKEIEIVLGLVEKALHESQEVE